MEFFKRGLRRRGVINRKEDMAKAVAIQPRRAKVAIEDGGYRPRVIAKYPTAPRTEYQRITSLMGSQRQDFAGALGEDRFNMLAILRLILEYGPSVGGRAGDDINEIGLR